MHEIVPLLKRDHLKTMAQRWLDSFVLEPCCCCCCIALSTCPRYHQHRHMRNWVSYYIVMHFSNEDINFFTSLLPCYFFSSSFFPLYFPFISLPDNCLMSYRFLKAQKRVLKILTTATTKRKKKEKKNSLTMLVKEKKTGKPASQTHHCYVKNIVIS